MWQRFLRAFAITAAAAIALSLAVILFVDPLGVSPITVVAPKSGYALKDRRFLAQQLIRNGQFDSFLVGSSTIHSVDPHWAEEAFGGEFANLAIHGVTPHELARVLDMIGRSAPRLRTVVLGLDAARWCGATPPARYHRQAVFPESLYDADRFDDFAALLNLKVLDASLKQLAVDLKIEAPQTAADGYHNELDDAKWKPFKPGRDTCQFACDEAAASTNGGGDGTRSGKSGQHQFPALPLLEQALSSIPAHVSLIVVMMPPYASKLPDTAGARADLDVCKRRIAALAGDKRGYAIDFDIASPWTLNAENYWDANDFRTAIAKAFIPRIKEAMERRRDAEDGVYRYLAGT